MSWMSQLYQTYENRAGKDLNAETQMTPIAHIYANAQLEVILNRAGEFVAVNTLEKAYGVTLIPVTESSAGRSSGVAPHALCDTLSYIAGDFADYCESAKQKKSAREKFESYIKNLKKWAESEESHPSVRIIYQYLSKKGLIDDLIKAGVVQSKEDHTLENKKIGGQPYEKVERSTYDKGETRDPNAVRLQSTYVNHPMQTLKILEQMMEPYFRKLAPGLREYYKSMISKIIGTFRDEDEPKMNQGLSENYLLGYYLQRAELNQKKDGGKQNEQLAE